MDNSIHEQEASGTQHQKSFLAGLSILDGLMNWLAGLIKLSEEEREEAGIYLGRLGGE